MNLLHKIKARSGFTLAETLLTVLILLLVSGIVATGIPVAKNVYDKTIVAANAQVLLSTAVTALKDELGTAWDVAIGEDGKSFTYFSADTGARTRVYMDGNTIKIQDYTEVDGLIITTDSGVGTPRPLISQKSMTDNLIVRYDAENSGLSGDTISINKIEVCRNGSEDALAGLDSLVIRPVSIHTSTT